MSIDETRKEELMSAHLDGRLSSEEREVLDRYLESAPTARAELEELHKMLTLMGGLAHVEAPPDLCAKVVRRLRRRGLLQRAAPVFAFVSGSLQVISIVVVLVIAALSLLLQLDQERVGALEAEPSPPTQERPIDPPTGPAAPAEDPAPRP